MSKKQLAFYWLVIALGVAGSCFLYDGDPKLILADIFTYAMFFTIGAYGEKRISSNKE